MKQFLFFLITTQYCLTALAQFPDRNGKSEYDQFIEQSEIKWAAYWVGSERFSEVDLSLLLRKRFERAEIKVTEPLIARANYSGEIRFYGNKDSFDYRPCSLQCGIGGPYKPDTCLYRFDSIVTNLFEVPQVFYVEKGRLLSYVPWVTIGTLVQSLSYNWGRSQYATVAFNSNYHFSPAPNDKIIFLGKTYFEMYLDSIPRTARLKEFYGRNFLEEMWPSLWDGNYDILFAKTNKKLNKDEFNMGLLDSSWWFQGFYEATFKRAGITQQWYYDETKNVVYNTVQELSLFLDDFRNEYFKNFLQGPMIKMLLKN